MIINAEEDVTGFLREVEARLGAEVRVLSADGDAPAWPPKDVDVASPSGATQTWRAVLDSAVDGWWVVNRHGRRSIYTILASRSDPRRVLHVDFEPADRLRRLGGRGVDGADLTMGYSQWKQRYRSRQPGALWWRARDRLSEVVRRVRRTPGMTIVLVGPDGSGKSTTIESLVDMVRYGFAHVIRWHLRPEAIRSRKGQTPPSSPHLHPDWPLPVACLKIAFLLCDFWLGRLFKELPWHLRSGLVVFDRHPLDLLVDPRRARLGRFPKLAQWSVGLFPKPDMVFYLNADPEVIVRRKAELTLEEATRQVGAYRALAEKYGWTTVSTDMSPEETATEIWSCVAGYQDARYRDANVRD